MTASTVPDIEGAGGSGRSTLERRTPSMAVVQSGRACRASRAVALPLDVGETGPFAAFRDTVAEVLRDTWQPDTFDYLVNNARLAQASLIEDTTEETVDRLMRALLKGPYFLTQKLLPLMTDGGAILNTSSNATSTGLEPGYSAYASMKGGLDVLTRYMAEELSGRGIRANAVSPGSTRTRLADGASTRFPEVIPALAAKTALGRIGEPGDIGAVIATLVSDENRWVTAQTSRCREGNRVRCPAPTAAATITPGGPPPASAVAPPPAGSASARPGAAPSPPRPRRCPP
ncbi:SDR family NAD(P)-dependent oxidoreductase [Streptomyces sp. NPDC052016]|uniref:SDR family NAD(P)-dependent oxidoreductase n=1 Tax=Streptomyces sp. NPDC052016 TaxID=3365680 RepID=UPI0037CDB125